MAKKKTLQDFGFPTDYEPAKEGLVEALIGEEHVLTEDDILVLKEVDKSEVVPNTTVTYPAIVAKPYVATWEQIRNQLGSVSAMKSELTGVRITHGDAIAIFKTDAHRKLYEEWAAFKRAQS